MIQDLKKGVGRKGVFVCIFSMFRAIYGLMENISARIGIRHPSPKLTEIPFIVRIKQLKFIYLLQ